MPNLLSKRLKGCHNRRSTKKSKLWTLVNGSDVPQKLVQLSQSHDILKFF